MIATSFRFCCLTALNGRQICLLHKYFVQNISSRLVNDEFRVIELYPSEQPKKKNTFINLNDNILSPREKNMKTNQDWPSVWPTANIFRPSVVPLPVYQGYDRKRASPGKYANAELMKIPNFLHLTPLAIKKQCEALKKFCNDFPADLKTDECCQKHFPIEIITSSYCHAAPTIRDERSRIVTLKIKLSALNLDYHGRDKFIRLVSPEHYCKKSDMITIIVDRCPLGRQNYDYLIYLLTALHHESSVTEPWEHEKTEADMEKFSFENSRIEMKARKTLAKVKSSINLKEAISDDEVKDLEEIATFGKSVTALINEGEDHRTIFCYKDAVLNMLHLKASESILNNE